MNVSDLQGVCVCESCFLRGDLRGERPSADASVRIALQGDGRSASGPERKTKKEKERKKVSFERKGEMRRRTVKVSSDCFRSLYMRARSNKEQASNQIKKQKILNVD